MGLILWYHYLSYEYVMSKPVSDFFSKFWWLCFGGIIYLGILILSIRIVSLYGSGLVLLYIPWLVMLSSVIGLAFWLIRYRSLFETLLVFLTYLSFGFAFIVMAPIAIDRSLSSFIFFYAVEHNGFPKVELSRDYKDDFFRKRIIDAHKGYFLVLEDNLYVPTFRAKMYYNLFYPLGKMTNMLGNYEQFVKEVESVAVKEK